METISRRIGLLAGDLALSSSEDELTSQWPDSLDRKVRAFRVLSAIWRIMRQAAKQRDADVVLVDVGPNLGAINRVALICAQHVVIPLAPDLYSLQGLRNLGPTLVRWRNEWSERRERNPIPNLDIPSGDMRPARYVVMRHAVRLDRPTKAYDRWMARIPAEYERVVLEQPANPAMTVEADPNCLAALKHYRSLMPLAQEARTPMFFLKPADGALGGHAKAVQQCYADFKRLAEVVARRCGISL